MGCNICRHACWGVAFSFFLFIQGVSAAGHLSSPLDQNDIEQRQRTLLEETARQRDAVSRQTPLPPVVSEPAPDTQGPCFKVSSIQFEGALQFDSSERSALSAPFLNTCMGLPQINALIRDVSQWYLTQGYITSRAFLPEQDLASGILTIALLEGRIESIVVNGQPDRITRTIFPHLVGHVLNLRDLEQGVDQLSRLRSLSYQLDIQPGTAAGQSIVNLKGSRGLPLQGSAEFDNSGQKSTGEEQGRLSLSTDNLLSLAEQWSIGTSRSTDGQKAHDATSWQASLSLPYGYWLFDGGYQYSDYRNDLLSRGYVYQSRGDTRTTTGNLSRTLYRDGQSKISGVLAVTHRQSRNFIMEQLLESSSYRLSSIRTGFNLATRVNQHFFTLNPTLTFGTDWFGADSDHGRVAASPRSRFEKWGLSGSYSTAWQQLGWLSTLYTQWTPDVLYSVERVSLGGEASVRGFKEQNLSGDVGGYLRNEVSWQAQTPAWLGQWRSWLAFDMGRVDLGNQGDSWRGMVGTAIGWEQRYRHVTGNLSVGFPISAPAWLNADPYVLNYRLSINF
ncbi:ShlB/FhaC/HecB family hemolysin secretion/activation protein [Aeromonas salmonicida]|uniref:ShlB/FhaC/HecB family hemolysin secretion/activation protein n=1 Tax=Aeromonas salmonicida TaxID=645 RepID=UPI00259F1F69|nr:ShlB/FhaC/HecB family hemolysin secretion/activation protein [Aeromonas salmonicida]MDM5151938.1 ShlB/FhaC/HecB family hemolysin secretion/activation protein [Aeromonas salmonicida]